MNHLEVMSVSIYAASNRARLGYFTQPLRIAAFFLCSFLYQGRYDSIRVATPLSGRLIFRCVGMLRKLASALRNVYAML